MKFGEEGESSDGWMMMIMAKEGRGTRNTNHVDVKMNCCKLGRRRPRWAGGRSEASSQGAHGEIVNY